MRCATLLLLLLLLSGCGTVPATAPQGVVGNRDATLGLIEHPQFQAAAKAAPDWVRQALRTITAYEAELASRSH